MIEILGGTLLALVGYILYSRKNSAEATKSELDVMRQALEVFKNFTAELTNKVNELTEEVNALRDINEKLQLEVQNLENLLKTRI